MINQSRAASMLVPFKFLFAFVLVAGIGALIGTKAISFCPPRCLERGNPGFFLLATSCLLAVPVSLLLLAARERGARSGA